MISTNPQSRAPEASNVLEEFMKFIKSLRLTKVEIGSWRILLWWLWEPSPVVFMLDIFPCGNVLHANHHAQHAYCHNGQYLRKGYRKEINLRNVEQTLNLEWIRSYRHTSHGWLQQLLVHSEADWWWRGGWRFLGRWFHHLEKEHPQKDRSTQKIDDYNLKSANRHSQRPN